MNTKLLMSANALILGLIGIALSFLPQEIVKVLTLRSDPIVLQLLGALYLGFAMLNWMNKEKILGGIYGRPIVMANFAHFMIGGMALIKFLIKGPDSSLMVILTVLYAIFGLAFAFMAFTHANIKNQKSDSI